MRWWPREVLSRVGSFRRIIAQLDILVWVWSLNLYRISSVFLLVSAITTAQVEEPTRLNQHKVTNRSSPAPEPGAETQTIPSLIEGLRSADEWRNLRRPQLLRLWTTILVKLGPNE